jgi:hypothetical protein
MKPDQLQSKAIAKVVAQHAAVADRCAREIVGFWAAVPSARGG